MQQTNIFKGKWYWYQIGILIVLSPHSLTGQIVFKDVAKDVGIDYLKSEWTLGNGLSFVDFDNDGWDDITIATEKTRAIQFYRNQGGTFEKIDLLPEFKEEVKQVLWVDFDNDGDEDLFCAVTDGISLLFENTGDLNLTDITEMIGLPMEKHNAYGATWGDINRDGYLDLYLSDRFGLRDRIFINNHGEEFIEMSYGLHVDDSGKLPFCSAFLDFNNDLWPDIFTANDKLTGNTLLENSGNCVFIDVSEATGTNLRMNAMCVAVGDYDNDGWQDIYISNTAIGNSLMHNNGKNESGKVTFSNLAATAGVGFYNNSWGSNFLDSDNDGDLDLYVSGSQSGSDAASVFYENMGDGTFIKPSAGFINDTAYSFSNTIGDYNNDGYPDILVQNEPPFHIQLWQNSGGTNNWLKLNLVGVTSNRDAIGAKIDVYASETYQMRYIHCGIGFLGQNSLAETIGLRTHEMVDSIIINWPSGHIDKLYDVAAKQSLTIEEGSQNNGVILIAQDVNLNCSIYADYPFFPEDPSIVTNLDNESVEELFQVYPNPGTSEISIESEKGEIKLKVISSKGEVLMDCWFNDNIKIETSSWLPGIYMIELLANGSHPSYLKWIKL